ncbi:hypothetical protein D3C86_1030520 [compost metagenome]
MSKLPLRSEEKSNSRELGAQLGSKLKPVDSPALTTVSTRPPASITRIAVLGMLGA